MVSQSTASFFAPNAFWSIHKTIEKGFCPEEGCAKDKPQVLAYHTWIPSFGDWGFNMARRMPVDPTDIDITVKTRYVENEMLATMFYFPRDMAERDVKINRLIEPVLLNYYIKDWHSHNQ
jgi:spermidine synthase